MDQQLHYEALRREYPLFIYESFSIEDDAGGLKIQFEFKVGEKYCFRPQIHIPSHPAFTTKLSGSLLESLVFHIGMVEMISYWKAFCSQRILVKPFALDEGQQQWWKKLFLHGLGEFFFTNGITVSGDELLDFEFSKGASPIQKLHSPLLNRRVLVPVGGGKDSAVTLELLRQFSADNLAVVVNQRGATRQVLEAAGYQAGQVIDIHRSIDPLLLELNQQGFLNGHTPFSALLAFVCSLAGCLSGSRYIALSNESSANEPSIPGTTINHQYSKSLEFERDFRNYFSSNIFEGLEYFSFLRPLNELQIAALFSRIKYVHPVFKSCNAGSKTDSWCGKCSKCLFTFIILSPFLTQTEMLKIFGQDLFEDKSLISLMDQLSGASENKPFECVGTLDEVNISLTHAVNERKMLKETSLPALLEHYAKGELYREYCRQDLTRGLKAWHEPHFLKKPFDELLENALRTI